jgi:ribosomal protein S18 acetylase RimI-like enzyme
MAVEIAPAQDTSPELMDALTRLLAQLTNHAPPTATDIQNLLATPGSTLFLARVETVIVGAATLTIYRIPTGIRARVDDVVVDESARGKGIGEALMQACIAKARAAHAESLVLSSGASRTAANHLYQKLGFERWESNHYRLWLA